jgi:hypothetical protein
MNLLVLEHVVVLQTDEVRVPPGTAAVHLGVEVDGFDDHLVFGIAIRVRAAPDRQLRGREHQMAASCGPEPIRNGSECLGRARAAKIFARERAIADGVA